MKNLGLIVAISVFVSSLLYAQHKFEKDPEGNVPRLPDIDKTSYYDHEDVYTEILDYEAETGITIDQNFDICIDGECKRFYHKGTDNSNHGTFTLPKKKRPSKGKPGTGTGIQPVLNAIGNGIAVGGSVTIKGLEVNADGSFRIQELQLKAGATIGTDKPIVPPETPEGEG